MARAPALQAGGHRFDSDILHHNRNERSSFKDNKKFFQTEDVIQSGKAGGSIGSRPTHLHLSGGSRLEASERGREEEAKDNSSLTYWEKVVIPSSL